MGKGDIRSKKGKRVRKSYGKTRQKSRTPQYVASENEVKVPKKAAEKKPKSKKAENKATKSAAEKTTRKKETQKTEEQVDVKPAKKSEAPPEEVAKQVDEKKD